MVSKEYSDQREREGEAPSGFASGGGDASPYYDGLLVIDKPAGWTSNDVVQKVKRMLRAEKVGHTGTLDPAATGVLVLCLNQATKWAAEICEMSKTYDAKICLGQSTDTGDAEGQVVEIAMVPPLKREAIEKVMDQFRGRIRQTIPTYSAVRIGGKRLYSLARRGKIDQKMKCPTRVITIHTLKLNDWQKNQLSVFVSCSKGTYIRTLAKDIGVALGVPAHLGALRRLSIGPFGLKQAITLEELSAAITQKDFQIDKWILPRDYGQMDGP